MKKFIGAMAAATAFAGMAMAPAMANTITFVEGGTTNVAQIDCNDDDDMTVDCLGIVGGSLTVVMNAVTGGTMGMLDASAPFTAEVYDIGNNNESNEAAALNALAGTSFTGADATRTDAGGVGMLNFSTMAEWIVIATGAGQIFIHNETGGAMALNIDFSQFAGTGGGLSHYTEFGTVVPVPGALWLMGAGLAGLGFASRKKRKAA